MLLKLIIDLFSRRKRFKRALTFIQLRGQIHAKTWCCEIVGSCKVQFLLPRKWMSRQPVMYTKIVAKSSLHCEHTSPCGRRVGVWACILIFMWLQGKIRVGEWCCKVVGSCEVQHVVRCGFSTSSQPDKNLYVGQYVCDLWYRVSVCVWSVTMWPPPLQ